jgi:hypothetical protein
MSRKWYDAGHACLQLAEFTAKPHLASLQTIHVLSMSAHAIGASAQQFIMFGASLRIAQYLGLQTLSYDPELDNPLLVSGVEEQEVLLARDIKRRVWAALCIQDWFSVVSANMYSINKLHFSTTKPERLMDESCALAPADMPQYVDFNNWVCEMAALLVEFHDARLGLSDASASFQQVLEYDAKFRTIGPSTLPRYFFTDQTEHWIRWARALASIVHANKIIMIHRNFFAQSFSDPRYEYSRWVSINASKTIVRNIESELRDPERPAFWNDQVRV